MKKALIILMAVGMLAGCNNNKAKGGLFGGLGNKNKDDYNKTNNNNNNNANNNNGNNNNGGNTNTGAGWTNTDRNTFMTECKNSMPDNPTTANNICPCVLDKLEKEYTDLNEADTKGGSEAGSRLAQECAANLNTGGGGNGGGGNGGGGNGGGGNGGDASTWSSTDRSNFVNDCTTTAVKGGMTQSKSESYCTCMQEKLEKLYPNAKDANKLTSADMETSQMKQMIRECLGMDQ